MVTDVREAAQSAIDVAAQGTPVAPMRLLGSAALVAALSGCAVVAVVDLAATAAIKTVGLAADAAIGAVKVTGKAVGAVADAVTPDAAPPPADAGKK